MRQSQITVTLSRKCGSQIRYLIIKFWVMNWKMTCEIKDCKMFLYLKKWNLALWFWDWYTNNFASFHFTTFFAVSYYPLPITVQCSLFILPENIGNHRLFDIFREYKKRMLGSIGWNCQKNVKFRFSQFQISVHYFGITEARVQIVEKP